MDCSTAGVMAAAARKARAVPPRAAAGADDDNDDSNFTDGIKNDAFGGNDDRTFGLEEPLSPLAPPPSLSGISASIASNTCGKHAKHQRSYEQTAV